MKVKVKSLLEKAKAVPFHKSGSRYTYDEESAELAIAWMRDQVTGRQVAAVIGVPGRQGSLYNWLALALRDAYRRGKLSDASSKPE